MVSERFIDSPVLFLNLKGRIMLIKYTRKQINQQVDRFRKTDFVTAEDAQQLLLEFIAMAIKAGADETEMMELINGRIH